MNLRLERIEIRNFKGIKDLQFVFGGEDVRIMGDNATGKTSVADAFSWLLFGKDSAGDKAFPIKPKDENGNEIHFLVTEVSAVFSDGGKKLSLVRRMEEKWTKKRGHVEDVYGGNTESFFINEVPTKFGEYNRFIASMVGSEEIFALVTSPMAFNSLDWKKRREMLIKISGFEIGSVLASDDRFGAMISEMQSMGLTVDKYAKVYKDRRKMANDRLNEIPSRIDEASRGIEEVTDQELKDARYSITECESTIATCETLIAQEKAGGDGRDLAAAANAARFELESYVRTKKAQQAREVETYERKKSQLESMLRTQDNMVQSLGASIESKQKAIDYAEIRRGEMRKRWSEAYERKFDGSGVNDTCPTCGQRLQQDKIDEAVERARQAFNDKRNADLDSIKREGVQIKTDIEIDTKSIQQMREDTEKHKTEHARIKAELDGMGAEPDGAVDFTDDAEYKRLQTVVDGYSNVRQEDFDAQKIEALEARKTQMRERMKVCNEIVQRAAWNEQQKKRIAELEAEQKDAAASVAEYEAQIMLIEAFVQKRSAMIEESVNDLFPSVRWQLTQQNINGGIDDVCNCLVRNETTGALVQWSKANNAGKINAGLEIVNVLSKYYGVEVPVFIDNAESVNEVIQTLGQRICLAVTQDKALRYEVEAKEREVA